MRLFNCIPLWGFLLCVFVVFVYGNVLSSLIRVEFNIVG